MEDQEADINSTRNTVERLADVAHLITSREIIGAEAFQQILKFSLELTSADFGTIYLYDKETQTLRLAAYYGHSEFFPVKSPYRVSQGITGYVLSTRKAYVASDVATDPNYVQLFPETKSVLAIPISYLDEIVGVLSLESAETHHFSQEQIEIVQLLASFLASAFKQAEIERLRSEINLLKLKSESDTAFVLAPFREPFNKYYSTIIKPAVQDAGLISLRADEIFSPTEIIKDIWLAVNNAKVIIAELTTRNPNVMYELGLSHAVNKPVVMISQSVDDIPFDLRSLRCIIYDTTEPDWAERLKSNLTAFINSVLMGKGDKGLFHKTEMLS